MLSIRTKQFSGTQTSSTGGGAAGPSKRFICFFLKFNMVKEIIPDVYQDHPGPGRQEAGLRPLRPGHLRSTKQ